jgi:hypothetical protein
MVLVLIFFLKDVKLVKSLNMFEAVWATPELQIMPLSPPPNRPIKSIHGIEETIIWTPSPPGAPKNWKFRLQVTLVGWMVLGR